VLKKKQQRGQLRTCLQPRSSTPLFEMLRCVRAAFLPLPSAVAMLKSPLSFRAFLCAKRVSLLHALSAAKHVHVVFHNQRFQRLQTQQSIRHKLHLRRQSRVRHAVSSSTKRAG
jgi:hypothetical protein